MHKKTGAFTSESGARSGNGQILTWAAAADYIHRRQRSSVQLCYVPYMDHVGEAMLRHLDGKRLYLACPQRLDTASYSGKRKAAYPIKERAESECGISLFDTSYFAAATIVLVVFTAACAVYTTDEMCVFALVSRPNIPAILGTSLAESISPIPSSG